MAKRPKGEPEKGDTPSAGITLVPAHFPGRAPIDAYGNGGFRFAEMSHQGSILCLPSGIYGWNAKTAKQISVKTFQRVLHEEELEVVLVGTGADLLPLPKSLLKALAEKGLRADPMSTGAAARTYNVLLAEGRAIGAALLAVD